MTNEEEHAVVDALVARARIAQQQYITHADQLRFDHAALAVGWALMQPERNQNLSTMAVAETGLGKISDKITKNHRKTLGLLRDIQNAQTHGILEDNAETGLIKIARPIGVIGAVVPSTNPVATPTNNIINALKCGNAIILAPSPKGANVCAELLGHIHAEFQKLGLPKDLVQMLPTPPSKVKSQRLMEKVDLLIVTGSQDNVRRAYRSGTPAIGVGAGNVTVIVDETADLNAAAAKIMASKTFDHATSCSSENAIVVLDEIYDDFLLALDEVGGRLLNSDNAAKLKAALFQGGHLNRDMIAREAEQVLKVADITLPNAKGTKFLVLPAEGIGSDNPESGEKLSVVLSLYRARDFDQAKEITAKILSHQGAGHSIGIHTTDQSRATELGFSMPICRVIVNQAHCFATGGAFNNGMPFSLSMGCGSWGGNSIDDNLHYRHFMNITKIVREIPAREPSLESIFNDYWQQVGQ